MKSNFTSQEDAREALRLDILKDVRRFRQWIRYLAHPEAKLGLLSGRFHGKYLSRDPQERCVEAFGAFEKEVNIRDNALLVKQLDGQRAMRIKEEIRSMDAERLRP